MLIDANVLIYAVDSAAPAHARAAAWLTQALNSDQRVGMPWESLTAFVRIVTHPRAAARPLGAIEAWRYVDDWLAVSTVWTPGPTERHPDVLGSLVRKYRLTGNLVPDCAPRRTCDPARSGGLLGGHGLRAFHRDPLEQPCIRIGSPVPRGSAGRDRIASVDPIDPIRVLPNAPQVSIRHGPTPGAAELHARRGPVLAH